MKIQYALMSCNANPRYTSYWPTVAAAWLKLDITPVLLFIPDNPSVKLPDAPGIVHTIPPLKDVHIMPQLLMLPFWASHLYPNATLTCSDMDYVPLSRQFLGTQLMPYPEHAYIHLAERPSYAFFGVSNINEKITSLKKIRYICSWFHIARGEVMQRVLELSPDWETTCKKILPYYVHKTAVITTSSYDWKSFWQREGHAQGEVPWGGDEIYTSIRLHHSDYQPIYYLGTQKELVNWETVFRTSMYHTYRNHEVKFLDDLPRPFSNNQKEEEDYLGIHLGQTPYEEGKTVIEHLLVHHTIPRPSIILQVLIRCLNALVRFTTMLGTRVRFVGPWFAFALLILVWMILQIPGLPKIHKRMLLRMNDNGLTALRTNNYLMDQTWYRLVRIRRRFAK